MSVTREDLAAWADGELTGARGAEVEAAIAADPALARQVAAHRELKAALGAHYAPILEQKLPERLTAPLASRSEQGAVDFTAAKERREARFRIPRWSYIAAPALAATLALALFIPRGGEGPVGAPYADAQLAGVLDNRLVAEQSPNDETRVLVSFRDETGAYCRAFSGTETGGIACRDETGWRLEALGAGSEGGATEYRQAGASAAELMARAQEMAAGPALDAEAEAEARESGWLEAN